MKLTHYIMNAVIYYLATTGTVFAVVQSYLRSFRWNQARLTHSSPLPLKVDDITVNFFEHTTVQSSHPLHLSWEKAGLSIAHISFEFHWFILTYLNHLDSNALPTDQVLQPSSPLLVKLLPYGQLH